MTLPIVSVRLRREQDLVAARQRARMVASSMGFDGQDQIRIATAVSEIARNAVMYGGGGKVEFAIDAAASPQRLVIRVTDTGPGIDDVTSILQGRYQSQTGMGLGIQGARRLVDGFDIQTAASGTSITLQKNFPRRAPALKPSDLQRIAGELAGKPPENAADELQAQNRELLQTLEELQSRSEQLAQLNIELEDTNRGVVALYAELDEKAESLRKADELKSTFLSHMSHEFRTPLNSIMALARILLARLDGPLTTEQEKQVGFINRAAQELTEMVNDLLDLAKVEAGRIELRPSVLSLTTLFGTLRGLMRPLLGTSTVQLIFEDPVGISDLYTDESALSQILRNFISNAIKFTERGEIRVSASAEHDSDIVSITVEDTGIGIAPEDQARIFEQFAQLDNPRQRAVRGTGLGLPLSRKLAGLLGGTVTLRSQPGAGSAFTVSIPRSAGREVSGADAGHADSSRERHDESEARNSVVLVIDDEDMARYVVRKALALYNIEIAEAGSGDEGLRMAAERRPDVVILDLVMPGMSGFEVLDRMKSDPATRQIPVIIHTSCALASKERERLSMNASAIIGKGSGQLEDLCRRVTDLTRLARG